MTTGIVRNENVDFSYYRHPGPIPRVQECCRTRNSYHHEVKFIFLLVIELSRGMSYLAPIT
jgi:hypothetical protein